MNMTFKQFSAVNRQRCESPDGFNHPLASWSTSDWFTAILGELGEAANVAKKLNRYRDGIPGNKEAEAALRDKLRKELGDTFVYLDLLCQLHGFNIGEAAVEVFNAKSVEIGCSIQAQPSSVPVPPQEPETKMGEPPAHVIATAIEASTCSPCRSKRGAVLFRGANIMAHGFNYKPRGFACDGSAECKATCRIEAIHAEQQALLLAGVAANGAEFLHAKTINGALVPSGGPSCVQCSKLSLVAGVKAMWLYHEDGWRRYDAEEWHRLSLIARPSVPVPAALREYLQHKPECALSGNCMQCGGDHRYGADHLYKRDDESGCTCGLTASLAALPAPGEEI